MYQFFVSPEQIQGNRVIISGKDVNHIKNVLRMKSGEEINVKTGMDGKEYRCGILEFTEEEVICELYFVKEEDVELPVKISLFQGLPKSDKMEWIIQKAVELGVYEIIPVASKRAVVKLDEKKAKSKVARWQGISEAAAKQSKRAVVPQVTLPMSFREALAYCRDMDVKLIPYELAKDMEQTRKAIAGIGKNQSVAVFIGPEGGFAEEEIKEAKAEGMLPVTLGKRILRTETAGMCVLAFLLYQLEE
ncbi:MAG: 16S rRNA (uracil(1498)-N(3))-methyltransferase [Roseburia sp.]|nr:16S rRNA (uracil(1498)-N(3))-methyltransferase [Roseburia sp.]MCM1279395.1 16S rRNA (uracil(1498)-N(3))-methyltransferase [Robinsoniella sp.]